MAIDHSQSRIFEIQLEDKVTVGMTGTPDKRNFLGVADGAEPGCGQGLQYDKFVRAVLQGRHFRGHSI